MSWYSFDAMGEFLFDKGFGMMTSNAWHPAIEHQKGALALLGPLSHAIWLIRLGFVFLPWVPQVREWFSMVDFCEARMFDRMKVRPPSVKE